MSETAKLIIALVIYLVVGGKIILSAVRNIFRGEIFDENFLMVVASAGSIAIGDYKEAVMVMLLYRIGEWLQTKAVIKSRKSIAALTDIRPDYANIEENGELKKVSPESLALDQVIVICPGERIPVDCTVIEGVSRIDTAALSGEALPVDVMPGAELFSGSINLNGMLKARVTKLSSESTATRILELVEDAAENKGKAENFITRFARIYTPVVCACAVLIAVVPSLITGEWNSWIEKGLTFLIISCPCALVISIPLSFFGGIGGASSKGILIKGGNYLENLSKTRAIVFDKTGTLTKGVFKVVAVHPHDISEERLLELAALCESFSNHPIASSLAEAYGKKIDKSRVNNAEEIPGKGISSDVDGVRVICGNRKMMEHFGIDYHDCHIVGTAVHVAVNGTYHGHIIISDKLKDDSKLAVEQLRNEGIGRIVMLSGDKEEMAKDVADQLDIKECKYELMPKDKLDEVEKIMAQLPAKSKLAFVGDGINDAPVLARADVGVAMGGMGSAAAVEAADVVLMNDKPSDVALAIRHSRKVMKIIYEDIVFSLGVKVIVLVFTAFGYSAMWLAEFADIGVCMLAILNSMRTLRVK